MHLIVARTVVVSVSCSTRAGSETIPGNTLESNLVIIPATDEGNREYVRFIVYVVARYRNVSVDPQLGVAVPVVGISTGGRTFVDTRAFRSYLLTIYGSLGPTKEVVGFDHGVGLWNPYGGNNDRVGFITIYRSFSQDVNITLTVKVFTSISATSRLLVSQQTCTGCTNLVILVITLAIYGSYLTGLLTSCAEEESSSGKLTIGYHDLESTRAVTHHQTFGVAAGYESTNCNVSRVGCLNLNVFTDVGTTINGVVEECAICNRSTINNLNDTRLGKIHLVISTGVDCRYCQGVTPYTRSPCNKTIILVLSQVIFCEVIFVLHVWTRRIRFTRLYSWVS